MSITVTKRPYSKSFSGNPVYYQLYSALAASDTTVYFEIQVQFKPIGGSYAPVLDTPIPFFPVAGIADVDIKDILHAQMDFGLIEFYDDEKTCWHTGGQSGYFYLEFREITTANTAPSWDSSESSHECFVAKGGLNYFMYRGNNWWANYQPVQKPFLTWQKSGRKAALTERMYLAFLQLAAASSLFQKVHVVYTDGSTADDSIEMTVLKDAVHFIPAGATQLDLESLTSGKAIWYWEIKVEDESEVAQSETFRYYLDNQNDYNGVTLHYRNSLGGLDSVRIRGEIEEGASYNYTEQDSAVEPDYFSGSSISPQRRIGDNTEQITYKGNTGPLTREEQDRLRDAFINREVYQEIRKKWWPVVIITKSFTLRKTTDQRWSLPIEWELAYTGGDYYTPRAVDLGDGVFNDNVCAAMLSPLSVSVDMSGAQADVTITGTEVDPQNASTTFRYRLINDDSTATDWTTVAYADLPLNMLLPKEHTYIVEAQGICTGGVLGRLTTTQIDTRTPADPGGGGGGTPPPVNSIITNYASSPTSFTIIKDSVELISGYVGAFNSFDFGVEDAVGVVIELSLSFSSSFVLLESNGVSYTPFIFTGNYARFVGVTITDGIQIYVN